MTAAATSRLALLGGTPVRTHPWPQWPARGQEEQRAVLAALRDGDWGGFPLPNEHSATFAADFAERHDCEHALCVANGTVSLEVALQAMGVEPAAEVIVPAYTFEATASAALFAGCVPVFADIDPDTWCIDVEAAASLVTERTKAIVPVHLAMTVADLDAIGELAARHGLAVLEDCAHAHGARWRGRGVGSWGDAGSFSFQTSKLMTAGEGGIVTTSDDAILDRIHALVNCGRQRPNAAEAIPVIGHNYRMTDLQAAILEVQLGRLDRQHEIRAVNARHLRAAIEDIDGLTNLRIDDRVTTQAIYQFVFRFDSRPSPASTATPSLPRWRPRACRPTAASTSRCPSANCSAPTRPATPPGARHSHGGPPPTAPTPSASPTGSPSGYPTNSCWAPSPTSTTSSKPCLRCSAPQPTSPGSRPQRPSGCGRHDRPASHSRRPAGSSYLTYEPDSNRSSRPDVTGE